MRFRNTQSARAGRALPAALALSLLCRPAGATTKGLNQIVTPDIQPKGVLSLSFQQQDPNIGNRYQVQLELGITQRFEMALFEGFSPQETFLNAEYGLVQQKHFLLSTGFANYTSMGSSPQPYLEAGYLRGNTTLMAGAAYVIVQSMGVGGSVRDYHQTQAILGAAYRAHPRLLLQLDYQGGSGNFATAGFTYNITPQLQFNPAVYVANATGHAVYGYAVLTWNIQSFGGFPDLRIGGARHH
ncbi:MAG: hypothetical protein JO250_05165 [Armatimonadetes bacterium]|nr:hypothetical protein [Armatimonadota bacterium]